MVYFIRIIYLTWVEELKKENMKNEGPHMRNTVQQLINIYPSSTYAKLFLFKLFCPFSPEQTTTKTGIMKSSTIFILSLSLIILPFCTAKDSYYGKCRIEHKDCYFEQKNGGIYSVADCDTVCLFYSNTRARVR